MAETTGINILIPLAIGTSIMLLLAIAIISFVVYYQKKLINAQIDKQKVEAAAQERMLSATIQTQESERKRIAKDLHDEIGALLAAIRLGVIQISRSAEADVAHVKMALESKSLIEDTIKNVRRISHDLMPATLEKFGLTAALTELVKKLEKASGIRIDLTYSEDAYDLQPQSALALYRIVQELINNTLKHAAARKISINVKKMPDQLYLSVADDGKGFDLAHAQEQQDGKRALGMSSVDSRISLLHAQIAYDTAPGKGTCVTVSMPLAGNQIEKTPV